MNNQARIPIMITVPPIVRFATSDVLPECHDPHGNQAGFRARATAEMDTAVPSFPNDDGRVKCDWHLTMNTDGLG